MSSEKSLSPPTRGAVVVGRLVVTMATENTLEQTQLKTTSR